MRIEPDVHRCDVCGSRMRDIHCKLICPQCGYTRDCSDP
jgi:rubrerythrin